MHRHPRNSGMLRFLAAEGLLLFCNTPLKYLKEIAEHFYEDKDWIDAVPVSLDWGSTFWTCKANSISIPNLDLAI